MKRSVSVIALLCLAGCQSLPNLPQGQAAYTAVPARAGGVSRDYLIGPLDSIAVTVFQEPDLSMKEVAVDATGSIVLPLAGKLQAGGKTPIELAAEISKKLNQRYIVDPQVTVQVVSSASQRVTVSGAVTEAGVFEIKGSTTLLDAIAMAKGGDAHRPAEQCGGVPRGQRSAHGRGVRPDADPARAGGGSRDSGRRHGGDRLVRRQSRVARLPRRRAVAQHRDARGPLSATDQPGMTLPL